MNKKEENGIIAGIDLGTTNSCISIFTNGKYEVLENPDGGRTTPSVVSYDKEEKRFLVGSNAKRQASINPDTIFSVKRKMGTTEKISVEGKSYSPEQISSEILRYLVDSASEKLGEKINRVVITVPAYFDDNQRKATENAGRIAGLKVERIINEPTAASLAYGLDKSEKEQKILVYDLGGGTFDVSIVSITKEDGNNMTKVISTAGINDLGGDDFNKILVEHLLSEFKKSNNIDLTNLGANEVEKKKIMQRLNESAEQAKHELSSKTESTVSIPYIAPKGNSGEFYHLNVKITRAEFVKLTNKLMERTKGKIDQALKDAKLKPEQIDQIVLVGGSTRMPMVEDLVKEKFGERKVNKSVNPDEVVSIGAAIQGAILRGDVKDIILLDVTPLSLGIEVQGGMNDILIPRNTAIPTELSRIYSTYENNQTGVHIRVLQGERVEAKENKTLGFFELSGIEPAPRGVPQIEVTFSINSNGIVSVSAKDKKTNKENKITITNSQSLSEEEVKRMIKDGEENRAKGEEFKNNLETLNRAQTYCYDFEKQIDDLKKSKDFNEQDSQFQEFKSMYEELKKLVDEKDYPALKIKLEKIDELIKLSGELNQKMSVNNDDNNSVNDNPSEVDSEDDNKENS